VAAASSTKRASPSRDTACSPRCSAPASKHLQTDVGNRFPQVRRAAPTDPRAGTEVPRRRWPRPRLRSESSSGSQSGRRSGAHASSPTGAQPRGEQRLMRVAEGGVGDADGLAVSRRPREPFGPNVEQALTDPGGGATSKSTGSLSRRVAPLTAAAPCRLVDGHVGEVDQDLVPGRRDASQVSSCGTFLDEGRRHPPGTEVRVVQNRLQERNVGRDPANPELGDRPPALRHRGVRKSRPRQVSFDQHRIEIARRPRHPDWLPPSSRTPAPPGVRYAVMRPVSGRNPLAGSSVVIRHCSAAPRSLTRS
jgi:hypothetical protein